jgi:HPt (histidine-containing phosphotransfer) domain-containing protein
MTSKIPFKQAGSTMGSSLDPDILANLQAVMGDDGIKRLIDRLEARLRAVMASMRANIDDTHGVAGDADALVSVCGMHGFLQLSQAFRELEAACLADASVELPLQRVQGSLQSALGEISALKDAA